MLVTGYDKGNARVAVKVDIDDIEYYQDILDAYKNDRAWIWLKDGRMLLVSGSDKDACKQRTSFFDSRIQYTMRHVA